MSDRLSLPAHTVTSDLAQERSFIQDLNYRLQKNAAHVGRQSDITSEFKKKQVKGKIDPNTSLLLPKDLRDNSEIKDVVLYDADGNPIITKDSVETSPVLPDNKPVGTKVTAPPAKDYDESIRANSVSESGQQPIIENTVSDDKLSVFRDNLGIAIDKAPPETKNHIRALAQEALLTANSQRDLRGTEGILFPALILRDSKRGLIKDPNVTKAAEHLLTGQKLDSMSKVENAWDDIQNEIRWLPPEQQTQLSRVWESIQSQKQTNPGINPYHKFASMLADGAAEHGMPGLAEAGARYVNADNADKLTGSYLSQSSKNSDSLWGSFKQYWKEDNTNLPPPRFMHPDRDKDYGMDREFGYNNLNGIRTPACNHGFVPDHHQESMWKNPLVWMMMLQTGGSLMLPLMLMGSGGFGMCGMLPFLF